MDRRLFDLVDAGWEALDRGDLAYAYDKAIAALAIHHLAVDAYVILANALPDAPVRIALLREGVRAGGLIWADEIKAWRQTDFWGEIETRPYIRAVHFLALELWTRNGDGDRAEAASLVAHLLKINRDDNQGIRMLAYDWYPALGRWDDLTRLLRVYGRDERTETKYAMALDAYRRQDAAAEGKLRVAFEMNPHVPPLLLARRPPKPFPAATVAYRSADEAHSYVEHAYATWRMVPEALDWLKRNSPAR